MNKSVDKLPNIYDVAKLAGVSHQTVSRVINNAQYIRPTTREKVEKAMSDLGYIPNAAARSLVTAKSKIIGILVSDVVYHGPARMMNAIEMAARDAGYFAISISVDPHDVESIVRGVDHLRKIVIDGMIVMTPQSDSVSVVEKRVTNIPVVYVDIPERTKAKTVSVDNRTGGKVATQHLIELGHKNILHISGPERWFDSKPRRMGYEEAMTENRLTPVVAKGDWGTQTGYKVISEWDFKKNPITAVFAANDLLALGVMRALHDRGIAVPEQVSVIGYDDTPEAQYYEPPLTTMHQDFALLGKEAMEYLVATLNKIEPQKFAPLVPNLVVRKSTGRPPKK